MGERKIPKPFNIKFDPCTQPGYSTRSTSLDRFLGGAQIKMPRQGSSPDVLHEQVDLREKFGSGQVSQLLPSAIHRGKK